VKYLVIIEGMDGNYSAYSPNLPGCVAAGDTREETPRLMREAIALHLMGLQEDGAPIPPPASTAEYVAVLRSLMGDLTGAGDPSDSIGVVGR